MTEWILIGEACNLLEGKWGTTGAREEILASVRAGLLDSRVFKGSRESEYFHKADDLTIFATVAASKCLDDCFWPFFFDQKKTDFDRNSAFETYYLTGMNFEDRDGWLRRARDDFYISDTKVDWQLGHFHSRAISYAEPGYGLDKGIGFVLSSFDAYSVQVDGEAVERLFLGNGTRAKVPSQRATKYDWEAAFADVAAQFYHNVSFENLDARGVQGEIIRLLRSSFEGRKLAVPSDDTLKPKARMLLGSLRGKKP